MSTPDDAVPALSITVKGTDQEGHPAEVTTRVTGTGASLSPETLPGDAAFPRPGLEASMDTVTDEEIAAAQGEIAAQSSLPVQIPGLVNSTGHATVTTAAPVVVTQAQRSVILFRNTGGFR